MTGPMETPGNDHNMMLPPVEPPRQTVKTAGPSTSWDHVWMSVALTVARRSRCVRDKVGCVLVSSDNQIVSTGFNGPPKNYRPSEELMDHMKSSGITDATTDCSQWCPRSRKDTSDLDPLYRDCCANHSEINAIARADYSRLVDGTAIITSSICLHCAKALAALRIKRVVCIKNGDTNTHRSPNTTRWFLEQCGIRFEEIEPPVTTSAENSIG